MQSSCLKSSFKAIILLFAFHFSYAYGDECALTHDTTRQDCENFSNHPWMKKVAAETQLMIEKAKAEEKASARDQSIVNSEVVGAVVKMPDASDSITKPSNDPNKPEINSNQLGNNNPSFMNDPKGEKPPPEAVSSTVGGKKEYPTDPNLKIKSPSADVATGEKPDKTKPKLTDKQELELEDSHPQTNLLSNIRNQYEQGGQQNEPLYPQYFQDNIHNNSPGELAEETAQSYSPINGLPARASEPSLEDLRQLSRNLKGKSGRAADKALNKLVSQLNDGAVVGEEISQEDLESLPPAYQKLIQNLANAAAKRPTTSVTVNANVNAGSTTVTPYGIAGKTTTIIQEVSSGVSNAFSPTVSIATKEGSKGVRAFPNDVLKIFSKNEQGKKTVVLMNPKGKQLEQEPTSMKDKATATLAKVLKAIKRKFGEESDESEETFDSVMGPRLLNASAGEITGLERTLASEEAIVPVKKSTLGWWIDGVVALLTLLFLGWNSKALQDIFGFLRRRQEPTPENPSNIIRIEVWGERKEKHKRGNERN